MTFDRIRLFALALLCAALTWAVQRSINARASSREPDPSVHPVSAEAPEAAWVIPVEIVEQGQAPRVREVRVGP